MLKASLSCEVWQLQGSGLSVVAQNSVPLPGLEQIKWQAGPRMTACPVKLKGVKASHGHSAKLPGRSQRTYWKGTQPTTRSVTGDLRCSPPRPKKAGSASKCTCLIPRPPCRIGKLACNHWMSDMSMLEIWLKADLRVASKDVRPKWSTDGAVSYTHLTLPTNREV